MGTRHLPKPDAKMRCCLAFEKAALRISRPLAYAEHETLWSTMPILLDDHVDLLFTNQHARRAGRWPWIAR